MFVNQLLIDGTYHVEIDVDSVKIQQWYTEFLRRGYCNRPGIGLPSPVVAAR